LRPGDQIVALDGNRSSLEIATVAPGSVAQRLGLQVGDTVLGVNDDEVALPSELIRRVRAAPGSVKLTVSPLRGEPRAVDGVAEKLGIPRTPRPGESLETLWGARFAPVRVVTTMIYVSNRPGERITLGVRRRGVETPVTVVPEKVPARKQVEDASGKTREVAAAIGRIGVKFAAHPSPLGKAVGQGFRSSAGIVVGVVNMLWTAVRGKAAFEVGGPVLIVATAVEQARVGWDAVLQLCGLISVNLGILNLLPIPITDGGRLSLCLYEAIVGRRVSKQREIAWLLAGMVLFIVLFLTITFKDVFSLVTSRAP
jgi:membrane-associated protease RseP (regulator of RpoE activity)